MRRSKGGQVHPFEKFLELRSFNALISFLARCWEEVLNWFVYLFSLSGSRSSTGDVCMFHSEPRASDLKPIKTKWRNWGRWDDPETKIRKRSLRRKRTRRKGRTRCTNVMKKVTGKLLSG